LPGLALLIAGTALSGCVVAPARYPYRGEPPAAPAAPAMYFYPERGQSAALQDSDRFECYRLAGRASGVDPGMTPVSRAWNAPPAARRDGADVVGGAATGAILGAAVSSPRHAGENAVIGATSARCWVPWRRSRVRRRSRPRTHARPRPHRAHAGRKTTSAAR
jgi:hypothetical protein